jgi:23S rRNA (cytosine1962-C5)-methyltransferase
MSLHGVAITATGAERLAAGHPQLPLSDLVGGKLVPPAADGEDAGYAPPPGIEPGRPVRLLSSRGETLGTGVADPENGLVRIWGSPDSGAGTQLRAIDSQFFRGHARRAVAARQLLGLADGVSAYRLVNGEGDGLGGLAVDVYGRFAVVTALSRGLAGHARGLAEALRTVLPEAGLACDGVVVKVRLKAKGHAKGAPKEKVTDQIIGEAPPAKLVVKEAGVPYEVHLQGGVNVGLFSDMREHRLGLHRFVRGRRVLNTFAYTGALSLAAARAGAAEVTSVDLAGGVLAWARENFKLSGLDPEAPTYHWESSDVVKFLAAARAGGARYDVIILDPPTVSGARVSSWAQKRDYPELIADACALLPDTGGHLWVSSNTHAGPGVLKYVTDGLARARRRAALLELGGLPPDFPTPIAWPAARYLEVCQLAVGG